MSERIQNEQGLDQLNNLDQLTQLVARLENGDIQMYRETRNHELLHTAAGLQALADPENSLRVTTRTESSDGGDPYSEHYRGGYTVTRRMLVWGDGVENGNVFSIDLNPELEEQYPTVHSLRSFIIGDWADQLRNAALQLEQRAQVQHERTENVTAVNQTVEQVISQAQEGLAQYQVAVDSLRERVAELARIQNELGMSQEPLLIQKAQEADTAIDAVLEKVFQRSGQFRSVSLETMRSFVSSYAEELDRVLEHTTGETLEEYELSMRGENRELPDEETAVAPHELNEERLLFHIRELLRRYRHSQGSDPQKVESLVATFRRVTGGIDYKTSRFRAHKIEDIQRGQKEGMENLLLELRRLNGIEVPEPTPFDRLRSALRGVHVMDGNPLQIQQDEYQLVEQLIRFAELQDQQYTPHELDNLHEDIVSGLERAIELLRFAGDRTNQSLHYRKNRRNGREVLEGVLSGIMSTVEYAFPDRGLRPDPDTRDWGIYPRFRPSSGDIKRYARTHTISVDEANARLEGEYEEATQRLSIKGQVEETINFLVSEAEAARNRARGIAEKPRVEALDESGGSARQNGRLKMTEVRQADPAEKRIAESPFGPYRKIRSMEPELLEARLAILEAKASRTKSEERDLLYMRIAHALSQLESGEEIRIPSRDELDELTRRFELIRQKTASFPEAKEIEQQLNHDESLLQPIRAARAREEWLDSIMQLEEPAAYIVGNSVLESRFREQMLALIPESGELPALENIESQAAAIAEELFLNG